MMANSIQVARMQQHITQSELEERTGVSRSLISGYEAGKLPNIENLQKICKFLNLSIDEVYNDRYEYTKVD